MTKEEAIKDLKRKMKRYNEKIQNITAKVSL